MRRAKAKTPPDYDKALNAYRSRDYDESILLFQNLSLSNPPNKLKDNINEFNNMKVQWNNNELLLDNLDEDIVQNRENNVSKDTNLNTIVI